MLTVTLTDRTNVHLPTVTLNVDNVQIRDGRIILDGLAGSNIPGEPTGLALEYAQRIQEEAHRIASYPNDGLLIYTAADWQAQIA